jgi:hypothetical protein
MPKNVLLVVEKKFTVLIINKGPKIRQICEKWRQNLKKN